MIAKILFAVNIAAAALMFSLSARAESVVSPPAHEALTPKQATAAGFYATWGDAAIDGLLDLKVHCPNDFDDMHFLFATVRVYVKDELIAAVDADAWRDGKAEQWVSLPINKKLVTKLIFSFGYGNGSYPNVTYLVSYNTRNL